MQFNRKIWERMSITSISTINMDSSCIRSLYLLLSPYQNLQFLYFQNFKWYHWAFPDKGQTQPQLWGKKIRMMQSHIKQWVISFSTPVRRSVQRQQLFLWLVRELCSSYRHLLHPSQPSETHLLPPSVKVILLAPQISISPIHKNLFSLYCLYKLLYFPLQFLLSFDSEVKAEKGRSTTRSAAHSGSEKHLTTCNRTVASLVCQNWHQNILNS